MTNSVDEQVRLVLPADAEHVRLARLVASGVATGAGFDVERVDDLRIAVDEMCATLMQTTDRSVLLCFVTRPDGVVDVRAETTGIAYLEPDALRLRFAEQVLAALADRVEFGLRRGRAVIDLTMRAREQAAAGGSR